MVPLRSSPPLHPPYFHATLMAIISTAAPTATPWPTLFPSYSNGYVHNVHGNGYVLMSMATLRPSPAPHAPHGPPVVMATPTSTLFPSHSNGCSYIHGHPYAHPMVMATPTPTLFPSHSNGILISTATPMATPQSWPPYGPPYFHHTVMASYVHGHPKAFTNPTCTPWAPCGHGHPCTRPISIP